jgi:hypothetical protein
MRNALQEGTAKTKIILTIFNWLASFCFVQVDMKVFFLKAVKLVRRGIFSQGFLSLLVCSCFHFGFHFLQLIYLGVVKVIVFVDILVNIFDLTFQFISQMLQLPNFFDIALKLLRNRPVGI